MTENEIIQWMRNTVKKDGFRDAASLAREFLDTHEITESLDPKFSAVLDASFKIAQEVYSF